MKDTNFTEKILTNRHSQNGFEDLLYEISLHVYSILKHQYKMDDDERGDFFCIFYPKISGLIKRFEFYGTPFDGYLHKSIIWNIKAYRSAKSRYRSIEKASYKAPFYLVTPENDFTDLKMNELHIEDSVRVALGLGNEGELLSDTIKQRLLYIYLIEAENLDERLKEGIIRITGYKEKRLDNYSDILKLKVEKRLTRIKMIRNRRNSAFFNYHLLQEKCSFVENQTEKEELEDKIQILRKKIYKMNEQISKAPTRPTHKDIAEVLKVPRGSIDSGIYYLKTSFKEIDKKTA
jgi:hypothetical protein